MPPKHNELIVFQPYGDTHHLGLIDELCLPIKYTEADQHSNFEFDLFLNIRGQSTYTVPWGVFSLSFVKKTKLVIKEVHSFALDQFKSGIDSIFINPFFDAQAMYFNVWEQGGLTHGSSFERLFNWCIGQGLIQGHGIMGERHFALSNYFVATPKFWDAYLTYAQRILDAISHAHDPEIKAIANGPGHYAPKPQAAMRVFVMERLFSQFIVEHPELQVVPYPVTQEWAIGKYGSEFGPLFWELSRIKNRAIENQDQALLQQWDGLRKEVNALVFKRRAAS